jgi:CBS domain-containing protein
MTAPFPFDIPPFDTLNAAQQELVRATANLVQFAPGDPVLTPEMAPTHVFLLVQGQVRRAPGVLPEATYGAGTLFGARALLAARATSSSVALDAVRAWQIPKATLQTLLSANPAFCAAVFAEVARRLGPPEPRGEQREFLSLMMARVRDAYVRKPFYLEGSLDLVSACARMAEAGQSNALVRDGERLGMFTTTDLRDALLRPAPGTVPVRELARYELIAIDAEAELFEALLLMLRHRVHRVLVRDGAAIVGVLSQLDLMSFVSNHSHLIALQVEQARDLAELKAAALQLDGLVELLHGGGVKIEVIGRMVRVLNAQVLAKAWSFVAPPELVAHSCLVVMGSEGRGEQILKTDQDNALLLRDGYEHAALPQVAEDFNRALIDFGWPRCPGDIMLTNPLWRGPVAAFRERIRGWVYGSAADGPMQLAIFMDATAVAGEATLLQQAKAFAFEILPGSDAFMARFAAAADQFEEPAIGWWARLTAPRARDEQPFDLKKLGTFPIVQGVRALALQAQVTALGTTERLQQLATRQLIDAALARDLGETLHFLMGLKLKNNLAQRQAGQPVDNLVRMASLSTLERDRLQDALGIVRRFRQHLQQHFKLGAL